MNRLFISWLPRNSVRAFNGYGHRKFPQIPTDDNKPDPNNKPDDEKPPDTGKSDDKKPDECDDYSKWDKYTSQII